MKTKNTNLKNIKVAKEKLLPKRLLVKSDQLDSVANSNGVLNSYKCDYSSNYNGIYLPNIIFQQEEDFVSEDQDFQAQA